MACQKERTGRRIHDKACPICLNITVISIQRNFSLVMRMPYRKVFINISRHAIAYQYRYMYSRKQNLRLSAREHMDNRRKTRHVSSSSLVYSQESNFTVVFLLYDSKYITSRLDISCIFAYAVQRATALLREYVEKYKNNFYSTNIKISLKMSHYDISS